jgi:acyl carrier protein
MATANAETVRNDLRTFIAEAFFIGDEGEGFADSDSFMQKGIIDSTGVLELASFIEEKYQITVEDEDMTPANLDSVNNLVGYITSKLK